MIDKFSSVKIIRVTNGFNVLYGEPAKDIKVFKDNEVNKMIKELKDYFTMSNTDGSNVTQFGKR